MIKVEIGPGAAGIQYVNGIWLPNGGFPGGSGLKTITAPASATTQ